MNRINACYWPPETISEDDAKVYERIRSRVIRAHCSAGRGEHQCCGKVTMDRNHMLLQCSLCGDLKLNMKPENE